jgi:phage terminase large subunit
MKRDTHIKPKLDKIPDNYRRYGFLDSGLDMFYFGWAWVDADGYFRVYKEVMEADLTTEQAAQLVLRTNAGERLDGIFAPPDMWARKQDTGRSFSSVFASHGLYLTKSDARREQGWIALKELLKPAQKVDPDSGNVLVTARLTIDEEIANRKYPRTRSGRETVGLWEALTRIQRDKNDYNDVSDDNHDLTHAIDAARYFATGRSLRAVVPLIGQQARSAAHPVLDSDFRQEVGGYGLW